MTIRLALAQINPTVGDLAGNKAKIIDYVEQAHLKQADLIIFPELAVCGYPPEDLVLKKHFIDDTLKTIKALAKHIKNITGVIGYVDGDRSGNLYNAAALIHNQAIKGVYHKVNLPNYGVFDEARYFKPGQKNLLFALSGVRCGISICEDIWEKKGTCQEQAREGADVLINISASPFHAGKYAERAAMLKNRARQTKAAVCYVNMVGGQDELVFDGGSFLLDRTGKVLAAGKQLAEDLIIADVASAARPKKRGARFITLGATPSRKTMPISKHVAKPLTLTEEIYKALVLGTRDYVSKNGFKKAVIGLSGGIDSAVTAALAVDALGKENVVSVSMPSQYSSENTQSDAARVARALGTKFIVIPINSIFERYEAVLEKEFAGLKQDETEENLQARIRSTLLMAFSNKFGWLVLTTGNKSETAVGYCTLYGDMAGGFAVIKDVSKTMVYQLATYRNSIGAKQVIPASIIERPPTAELRPDQKDEDALPPYDVLDPILQDYIENDKSFEYIVSRRGKRTTVQEILRKVDRNEYKRRQAPPGIKITPKSFGKDRRLPITNRYTVL